MPTATRLHVIVMPVECACGNDDRSKCGCPQDCHDCGDVIALSGGKEWPEIGQLLCWDCMHDKLMAAAAVLRELHDYAVPDTHYRHSQQSRQAFMDAAELLEDLEA